ncbi:hypothetical protein ACKUSY_06200 [Myroides odoratus]
MKIYMYILSFLLVLCIGCQSIKKDSKAAIILDESFVEMFTGKKYNLKKLSKEDINKIDLLFDKKIRTTVLRKLDIIDLDQFKRKYFRQYLCYENEEGDKIVYVNGFCEVPSFFKEGDYKKLNWKKEMFDPSGGGNCYWSAEINLTKNSLTSIIINEEE